MQLCHQLCIMLLAHVKNYIVLFCLQPSLICFFSNTFDGHLVSMRVLA